MLETNSEIKKESKKFSDPRVTLDGSTRASVGLDALKTLWINTGTQCNLSCENCYIESSPQNDRLALISADEVRVYLDEIKESFSETQLVGITGGEPFLNPDIIKILEDTLSRSLSVIVLSNGYRLFNRYKDDLLKLNEEYGKALQIRISLDHFTAEGHEEQRGPGTFEPALKTIQWLNENSFTYSVAGRSLASESMPVAQAGYQKLFDRLEIRLKADHSSDLVVFPEMKSGRDVPEITVGCWDILNKKPEDQMCATERMVVKRKDEEPVVLPCTLLAYDRQFELGKTLKESNQEVFLNHRFCAEFCVLGGASCSSTAK